MKLRTEKGFTLIEVIVGIGILLMLVYTISSLLTSTFRSTQQGQESSDQIRTAGIVFRYLDLDFRTALPSSITLASGQKQGGPIQAPGPSQLIFWNFSEGGCRKIRYYLATIDIQRDELRREISNGGTIERTEHFGTGLINDFRVQVTAASDTQRVRVKLDLLGKKKNNEFTRIFSCGTDNPREISHWIFEN